MEENEISEEIIGCAIEVHAIDQQQLLTYLRLRDVRLGLIMNVHQPRLVDGVQRIVNGLPE
jgi:hypothetical protein